MSEVLVDAAGEHRKRMRPARDEFVIVGEVAIEDAADLFTIVVEALAEVRHRLPILPAEYKDITLAVSTLPHLAPVQHHFAIAISALFKRDGLSFFIPIALGRDV